ncbi:MAG TPA: DNA mismatch repair endonuclease MutL [Bacteroidales bacterium]|nr:DNA mismatch repair endonuclease MutL [Bacteroidales bacterium]HPS73323.1 DNA mismatch repair endonuclease MutL [Bacteroidales bacterium]
MADIIRLLPDSVANQIAAGEVVQRPASAVKELLENAVDSGATGINLIIKDAGKALIRVTDNGCGMSERDARMCFERHATSKIKSADDLMAIRTLGFRGEALASIASIAQVELKTRKTGEEVGTTVIINGSEFISQEPVNCPEGTDISIKNLFFNVPARRNFLKGNNVELKYITEEFFRVALVNPDIHFVMYNNDKILFQLPSSNLKQRIVNLFNSQYGQRLIPIEQESGLVNISGFIGKPEFAKKTRGEQYFFTNGRFIRNPYLHHAIENAFHELIPSDSFPTYFIYLEVEPQSIDINIHPTKTEINFQDARSIYAILNSAVKQSIGKFNLSPSLDFDTEKSFDLPPSVLKQPVSQPTITINPDYNPFEKKTRPQVEMRFGNPGGGNPESWKKLLDPLKQYRPGPGTEVMPHQTEAAPLISTVEQSGPPSIQLLNRFIVTQTSKGIVIIDQQAAHERILYERYLDKMEKNTIPAQRLLIPASISVAPDDEHLMQDLSEAFTHSGFEITPFGNATFLVHAAPQGMEESSIQVTIDLILEDYKKESDRFCQQMNIRMARSLAIRTAAKAGKRLKTEEMSSMISDLFSCRIPETSPDGKPTMFLLSVEELSKKFKTDIQS